MKNKLSDLGRWIKKYPISTAVLVLMAIDVVIIAKNIFSGG